MNARTHININRLKSSVPLLNYCAIETTCTKFQNKVKKHQGDQSRKFWCDDDDVDDRWRMLIVKWSDRVLFSKLNILRIMIFIYFIKLHCSYKSDKCGFWRTMARSEQKNILHEYFVVLRNIKHNNFVKKQENQVSIVFYLAPIYIMNQLCIHPHTYWYTIRT